MIWERDVDVEANGIGLDWTGLDSMRLECHGWTGIRQVEIPPGCLASSRKAG
jgi:hypothetical protein